MKYLLSIRRKESGFHPNAEQYVLHISDELFGFWRQNINRTEKIFCIFNVTDQEQSLDLTCLNLPHDGTWIDLVSNTQYEDIYETVTLNPYQFIWLKVRT